MKGVDRSALVISWSCPCTCTDFVLGASRVYPDPWPMELDRSISGMMNIIRLVSIALSKDDSDRNLSILLFGQPFGGLQERKRVKVSLEAHTYNALSTGVDKPLPRPAREGRTPP